MKNILALHKLTILLKNIDTFRMYVYIYLYLSKKDNEVQDLCFSTYVPILQGYNNTDVILTPLKIKKRTPVNTCTVNALFLVKKYSGLHEAGIDIK